MSSVSDSLEALKGALEMVLQDHPELKGLISEDRTSQPYGINMIELSALLMALHLVKDSSYGRSWAKRGEVFVFDNTMRKADRLDTLGKLALASQLYSDVKEFVGDKVGWRLVDALADIAVYCQMYISYIAAIRPQDFRDWLENEWCKSTGTPIEDIEWML